MIPLNIKYLKKYVKKIIIIVFILLLIVYAGLHIFVNLTGKALISKKLEGLFQKPATIRSLRTRFPFDLILKDVEVKDLFKIQRLEAGGGVIDIFSRHITLSVLRINGAQVNIVIPLQKKAEPVIEQVPVVEPVNTEQVKPEVVVNQTLESSLTNTTQTQEIPADNTAIQAQEPSVILAENKTENQTQVLAAVNNTIEVPPSQEVLNTAVVAQGNNTVQQQEAVIQDKPADNKKVLILNQIIINRILVKDSVLNIKDYNAGPSGINVVIKDLDFDIRNINIPVDDSQITSFELKGNIPWANMKDNGTAYLKGWIDFYKKDMQAILTMQEIDAIALYPYYTSWFDLNKARIQKAKLNFTCNMAGLNNNINAPCHLELTEIEFKSRSEGEPEERIEKIAHAVIDVFKTLNQGKIVLDFTLKTKMDSPEFGFANIKAAFDEKVEIAKEKRRESSLTNTALGMPAKLVEGLVRGVTDLSGAFFSGVASVGSAVGKTVGVITGSSNTPPAANTTASK